MEFSTLLEIVGQEPVFETGLLLAGKVDPDNVRRTADRIPGLAAAEAEAYETL